MEHAGEGFHFRSRQIQILTVNGDIDSDPVGGVQDFSEVFRVAVLPPTNTGLVRIVNAGHVAAAQCFAAIFFLEIGTLAHLAVSDRENAFRDRVDHCGKAFLDDFPWIRLDVVFHGWKV